MTVWVLLERDVRHVVIGVYATLVDALAEMRTREKPSLYLEAWMVR